MRKVTISHVSALSRAEYFYNKEIVPNMHPHHRKQVEDDLEYLYDVKSYLLNMIYTPGLPLTLEELKETVSDGHKSQ